MKKDGAICWVAPSSPRCWAVQSSDLAPVMVALDAEFLLVGPAGERLVRAGAFYHNDGMRYLSKQPDEVLAEVRLPATEGWDATYHKLRRRGTFDFPVLGVAAWIRWRGDEVADGRRPYRKRARHCSAPGSRPTSSTRRPPLRSGRRNPWTTPISRSPGARR
jgi:4-hydroxybenzoyl-CoA reductase subunit beta